MKRYVLLIIILTFSLIILAGCRTNGNDVGTETDGDTGITTDWEQTPYTDVNDLDDVTMTVKEDSISPLSISLIMENNSDMDYTYGEEFSLEMKINSQWYIVPDKDNENYGFHDIGYGLLAGEEAEMDVNFEWRYKPLEVGEYRVVKSFLDSREARDYDTHYLSAEFTIEE